MICFSSDKRQAIGLAAKPLRFAEKRNECNKNQLRCCGMVNYNAPPMRYVWQPKFRPRCVFRFSSNNRSAPVQLLEKRAHAGLARFILRYSRKTRRALPLQRVRAQALTSPPHRKTSSVRCMFGPSNSWLLRYEAEEVWKTQMRNAPRRGSALGISPGLPRIFKNLFSYYSNTFSILNLRSSIRLLLFIFRNP